MSPTGVGQPSTLEFAIGARIRARRRQLGVSQSELAGALGVSFQQVQKYERGSNRVAASTLVAIAAALKTTVAWLVGEESSARDDDDDVFRALSRPGAFEMLEAFNGIQDPRARAAFLSLAHEMASSKPAASDL